MKSNTDVFLTVWQSSAFKIIVFGTVAYFILSFLRGTAREFTDCGKCVTNAVDKYKELKS